MNTIAKLLIRVYQLTLSSIIGRSCRFHPSCSNYAMECYNKFSFLKATKLSFFRVIKCHPWNEGGIDNPPEK